MYHALRWIVIYPSVDSVNFIHQTLTRARCFIHPSFANNEGCLVVSFRDAKNSLKMALFRTAVLANDRNTVESENDEQWKSGSK